MPDPAAPAPDGTGGLNLTSPMQTGVVSLSTLGLAAVLNWAAARFPLPMPDTVSNTLVALIFPVGHVLYNALLRYLNRITT